MVRATRLSLSGARVRPLLMKICLIKSQARNTSALEARVQVYVDEQQRAESLAPKAPAYSFITLLQMNAQNSARAWLVQ